MEKIRFLIIGCGAIADVHAKIIKKADNAELIGVADVITEKAVEFAKKYNTKAYSSPDEALTDPEIDAVCVCTPSGFHPDIAIKVIETNKHVLIEKPLAITTSDCDRVIEAADKADVCAGVICQYRVAPSIRKVKEIISEGRLGEIVSAELNMAYFRSQEYYDSAKWRGTLKLDGGCLMNQGIHGVDALLYLMGDYKSVYGLTKTVSHDIEAEDNASALLEFKNGAFGYIHCSTSIHPGYPRTITICGTKGSVSVSHYDIVKCDVIDYELDTADNKGKSAAGFNSPTVTYTAEHEYQFNDFINAIYEKTA